MLIDTHCHVLSSEYDNVEKVITDSLNNGVDKLIINGYDVPSSIEAVLLANKFPNVYAAVGVGPEEANSFDIKSIKEFDKIIDNSKKIVAIGEIGLDYYWTKENKEKQIIVFKKMLELANKYSLPVIVHNREATEDVYKLLKESSVTGIIHCFSGSVETASQFIKLGFLLGIGGVITFKNSKKLKEVVKKVDLDNICLETDSPYLTPEPYRGSKNHPYYVIEVAKKIAEIKDADLACVIKSTSDNVLRKFDLN